MATLSESQDEVVYSVGRVGGWMVEAVIIYLVLAFPTGQARGRRGSRAGWPQPALVVVVLFLPTALLVEAYPGPTPATVCGDGARATRSWS